MLKFKWIIDIHIKNLNQRIIQLRKESKPCDLRVKLDQTEFLFWKPAISCLWMGLNLSFTNCKSFWMTKRLAKKHVYKQFSNVKWSKCILKSIYPEILSELSCEISYCQAIQSGALPLHSLSLKSCQFKEQKIVLWPWHVNLLLIRAEDYLGVNGLSLCNVFFHSLAKVCPYRELNYPRVFLPHPLTYITTTVTQGDALMLFPLQ